MIAEIERRIGRKLLDSELLAIANVARGHWNIPQDEHIDRIVSVLKESEVQKSSENNFIRQ